MRWWKSTPKRKWNKQPRVWLISVKIGAGWHDLKKFREIPCFSVKNQYISTWYTPNSVLY